MTTLIIEHVDSADLPPHWAQRLQAIPGQRVTVRIETEPTPVAADAQAAPGADPAFGIWADRDDMADPAAYVERIRRGRFAAERP